MKKESGVKDLEVFKIAYKIAIEIFNISKGFPKSEIYSLTDQIRRSSRSVCANLGEGYRKRVYSRLFSLKMTEADGECTETLIWLDFARDCGYISNELHNNLYKETERVGRILGSMARHPENFLPKSNSKSQSK